MSIKEYVLLEGIVGSKAYKLDTEDSDTDIKGIFVHRTIDLVGLKPYTETYNKQNCDNIVDDHEYTEVGKFVKLCLKCNPTYLEMLFLDEYIKTSYQGNLLLNIKDSFLSTNKVISSYCGYANSQLQRIKNKNKTGGRFKKHVRHTFRLLIQGKHLLETGNLLIDMTEHRKLLFLLGDKSIDEIEKLFSEKIKEFKETNSVLNDEPDFEKVNNTLLKIRRANYIL